MRISWICGAALLIGTACSSPADPFDKVHVTTVASRVDGSATTLAIVTTITNNSKEPVSLQTNTCGAVFVVETEGGDLLPTRTRVCGSISLPVLVTPGTAYRFDEQWDGLTANGTPVTGVVRISSAPWGDAGPQSTPINFRLTQ